MNTSVRSAVCAVLLCVGLCLVVAACFVGADIYPKQKVINTAAITDKKIPQNDTKEESSGSFYVLLLSGCIALACATIVGGLCGSCGGKDKSVDMSPMESGQLKNSDKFRSSFRIPNEKNNGDEFVVDDAHGNPLFVKIDDAGKPVVRDLGGNVLDVEVGDDRMVAVYNAQPPSTDRKTPSPQPPAYSEKPAEGSAVASTAAAAATTATTTATTTTAAAASAAAPAEAAKPEEGKPPATNPDAADAAPAPAPAAAPAAPASDSAAAAAPAPAEPAAPAEEAPAPAAPAPAPEPDATQKILSTMDEDADVKKRREEAQQETNSIISGLDDVMNDINAMWK